MARSKEYENIEFKSKEEFLNSIKSNCKVYNHNGKTICIAYYNEETPGYTMEEYNKILKYGGTLITEDGEEVIQPGTLDSHWVKLTTTIKDIKRGSECVNWPYEFNKNNIDSGKITLNDIKKDYLINQYGNVASYDLETGEVDLEEISFGHDGDGHFRIKGDNTSGTIHSMVRQTFRGVGLESLVPEKLFSEYKYYIKSPNIIPEPKRLNNKGIVKFCGVYFINLTNLLLALTNLPERKSKKGLDGVEDENAIPEADRQDVLDFYTEVYPELLKSIETGPQYVEVGPDLEYLRNKQKLVKVALDEASSKFKDKKGFLMSKYYRDYKDITSYGSIYKPLVWNSDYKDPELNQGIFYFTICAKHYIEYENRAPGFMIALDKYQGLGVVITIGKEYYDRRKYKYCKFNISKIVDTSSKEYKELVDFFLDIMLEQTKYCI